MAHAASDLVTDLDAISRLTSRFLGMLAPLSTADALAVVGLVAGFTIDRRPEEQRRETAQCMADALVSNASHTRRHDA